MYSSHPVQTTRITSIQLRACAHGWMNDAASAGVGEIRKVLWRRRLACWRYGSSCTVWLRRQRRGSAQAHGDVYSGLGDGRRGATQVWGTAECRPPTKLGHKRAVSVYTKQRSRAYLVHVEIVNGRPFKGINGLSVSFHCPIRAAATPQMCDDACRRGGSALAKSLTIYAESSPRLHLHLAHPQRAAEQPKRLCGAGH